MDITWPSLCQAVPDGIPFGILTRDLAWQMGWARFNPRRPEPARQSYSVLRFLRLFLFELLKRAPRPLGFLPVPYPLVDFPERVIRLGVGRVKCRSLPELLDCLGIFLLLFQ